MSPPEKRQQPGPTVITGTDGNTTPLAVIATVGADSITTPLAATTVAGKDGKPTPLTVTATAGEDGKPTPVAIIATLGADGKPTPLAVTTIVGADGKPTLLTITTSIGEDGKPTPHTVTATVGADGKPTPITTPTTTSTPPPTNTASKSDDDKGKDGLSGGAVAGVAIGCLVAGAAIAAIILLLLFRRRRNKQPAGFVQHHLPYNGAPEKVPIVATTAVASSIDNHIPQPVEDDAITKELSRLRDNIKNHVRTYYHFDAVGAANIPQAQLVGLAAGTGISTAALEDSLLNPAKRDVAIRLYVAWVILSRCEGNRLPSLLPGELAVLAAAVPTAQSELYSKWKTITGVLLQQRAPEPSVQSQSIAEALADLNTVLAPFVQGSVDGGQRRRNLEMILSRAASFAFLLFSQPGSFRFDFASQRGALVVFPGVEQVVGDQAQVLSPPRLLWEKEYAAEA